MKDKQIIVRVIANNTTKINVTFKIPLREEMLNDLIIKLLDKYMDAEIEVLYDR